MSLKMTRWQYPVPATPLTASLRHADSCNWLLLSLQIRCKHEREVKMHRDSILALQDDNARLREELARLTDIVRRQTSAWRHHVAYDTDFRYTDSAHSGILLPVFFTVVELVVNIFLLLFHGIVNQLIIIVFFDWFLPSTVRAAARRSRFQIPPLLPLFKSNSESSRILLLTAVFCIAFDAFFLWIKEELWVNYFWCCVSPTLHQLVFDRTDTFCMYRSNFVWRRQIGTNGTNTVDVKHTVPPVPVKYFISFVLLNWVKLEFVQLAVKSF